MAGIPQFLAQFPDVAHRLGLPSSSATRGPTAPELRLLFANGLALARRVHGPFSDRAAGHVPDHGGGLGGRCNLRRLISGCSISPYQRPLVGSGAFTTPGRGPRLASAGEHDPVVYRVSVLSSSRQPSPSGVRSRPSSSAGRCGWCGRSRHRCSPPVMSLSLRLNDDGAGGVGDASWAWRNWCSGNRSRRGNSSPLHSIADRRCSTPRGSAAAREDIARRGTGGHTAGVFVADVVLRAAGEVTSPQQTPPKKGQHSPVFVHGCWPRGRFLPANLAATRTVLAILGR